MKKTSLTSILVAFPSHSRGGCEEYALTIARAVNKCNIQVHTLFPNTPNTVGLQEDFATFAASYTPLVQRYWLPGRYRRLRFVGDILRIIHILLKKKPDTVHISLPWPDTSTELLVACALTRIRTVVTFQLVGENFRISPKLRKWYLWTKSRNQSWIAVSENNRQILSSAFGIPASAIELIPNGVKLPDNIPNVFRATSQRKIILTVARLSHQKGLDLLLRAFANVMDSFLTFDLVWIGDGEIKDELLALASELNVESRLALLGRRTDVADWLHNADLFVLPSRSEGQSFALLEAMKAGLPIVASNASSIPDLINHGREGLLFEKEDVLDLAQKIKWALYNPQAMIEMGQMAKSKAGQFSHESMIRKTLGLLGIIDLTTVSDKTL